MNSEDLARRLFFGAALFAALITIAIFLFMLILGLPLFTEGLFFELLSQPWRPDRNLYGILPMLIGSLATASLGLIFALPLSLGCALLVAVVSPRGPGRVIKKIIQMMTGVPTVIYGFVGIFLLVPLIRRLAGQGSGLCLLTAALMLALMIAPTMIIFFSESFAAVPRTYLQAVDALGGGLSEKFFHVILPQSWRGLATGLILALGRALGDTLIALMLAGNAVVLPDSVFSSVRTLTSHIAMVIAADYHSIEFKTIFACGLLLYFFTTLAVLAVRRISPEKQRRS